MWKWALRIPSAVSSSRRNSRTFSMRNDSSSQGSSPESSKVNAASRSRPSYSMTRVGAVVTVTLTHGRVQRVVRIRPVSGQFQIHSEFVDPGPFLTRHLATDRLVNACLCNNRLDDRGDTGSDPATHYAAVVPISAVSRSSCPLAVAPGSLIPLVGGTDNGWERSGGQCGESCARRAHDPWRP